MSIFRHSCKAMCFMLFIAVNPAAIAGGLPGGITQMIQTAAERSEADFRAVFETALKSFPGDRMALLEAGKKAAEKWMLSREINELTAYKNDLIDEKARQRARGIWYYLDPTLWDGKINLGAGVTSGDTSERSAQLDIRLSRSFDGGWTHGLALDVDVARRAGATSRRRFLGEYDLRYDVGPTTYVINNIRTDFDRFSGYDYRLSESASFGFSLFKSLARHSLDLELGGGLRLNRLQEIDPTQGDDLTLVEVIGRSAIKYNWKINGKLSLDNRTTALAGSNSITLENNTAIDAAINSSLSARLAFIVNYESEAPEGSSPFDTVTRISLGYRF